MRAALVIVVLAMCVAIATPAEAACHSFTVSASPSSVAEGGKVTVTVKRDAAQLPSDVRVSTIDESARAPDDYSKLDQQVEFTDDTSRTFEIITANDAAAEGAETFRVHLSDPGGCTGSGYAVGPDARVTIQASDPTPPPAPPPGGAPVTPAPAATPAPSPTPSPTATVAQTATPSPSPTLSPLAVEEEDDGGLPVGALIGLIAGGLAAAGGVGLLLYRRRMA